MNVLEWAKSHPVMIAGGIFFLGLLFLLSRGGGGGDNGASAFYAAQAAQKQSGDAVMIAQISANSQTSMANSYFGAQERINTKWADTQLATTNANNAAAIQMAPYNLRALYLNTVAEIAAMPPQTVTSTTTKKKKGFFGIGGGSSTSTNTTVVPNPAWDFLTGIGDVFDDLLFLPSATPGLLTHNPGN